MTKTIAQIWNGTLTPLRGFGKDNPELRDVMRALQKNLETLQAMPDGPCKQLFGRYADNMEQYAAVTQEQAFCDGFCLGAKIAVEALTGGEQIASENV